MDKSKNVFLSMIVLMFLVLLGSALFFLFSPRSSGSGFIVVTIGFIVAVGIGWYVRKKFPRGSRTPLWFLVFLMILITLPVGHAGYRLAIEWSTYNLVRFILFFAVLINSIHLYMKEKKAASTLPNNKKEI